VEPARGGRLRDTPKTRGNKSIEKKEGKTAWLETGLKRGGMGRRGELETGKEGAIPTIVRLLLHPPKILVGE